MLRNIFNRNRNNPFESYDRNKIKNTAAKFFTKNDYMFVRELGSGSYGDVIAVKKATEEKVIAAKIIHKDHAAPGEIYLWPCFRHPNVLPLLKRT